MALLVLLHEYNDHYVTFHAQSTVLHKFLLLRKG